MEGAEDRKGTSASRKLEDALWSITALTSEAAYSLWAHQVKRAPHVLSRWDRAAPGDIAKGPSVRVQPVDLVIKAIAISLRKAVKCGPLAPMWFKARGIKRFSEDVDNGIRDLLSAAIFLFSAARIKWSALREEAWSEACWIADVITMSRAMSLG